MEFNPWIPVIIACLALWIAYQNYVRGNYPIVRVESASVTILHMPTENGEETSCNFKLLLRNLGVPLHDIEIEMQVVSPGEKGHTVLRFKLPADGGKGGPFLKGMVATHVLDTRNLDKSQVQVLQEAKIQNVVFILYANSYRVWVHRLNGFWSRKKMLWNRLADRMNCVFISPKTLSRLDPFSRSRFRIPFFISIEDCFTAFQESLSDIRYPG